MDENGAVDSTDMCALRRVGNAFLCDMHQGYGCAVGLDHKSAGGERVAPYNSIKVLINIETASRCHLAYALRHLPPCSIFEESNANLIR